MVERDVRKRKTRKEFEGLSREEKKAIVMGQGTEALYMACPMCSMNRSLKKYLNGEIRFTDTDLGTFKVLVTRIGGGLGSGFFRMDEKSYTLDEMKAMPEYQDILQQIKEQAQNILEALK